MAAVRAIRDKWQSNYNKIASIYMEIAEDSFICIKCYRYNLQYTSNDEKVTDCNVCGINMQHIGALIIITGEGSLDTMLQMTESGCLEKAACFMDHQSSRVVSFTTLGAYVYDPLLRRISPLYSACMKVENAYGVLLAMQLVDGLLNKHVQSKASSETSRHLKITFNPFGYLLDESGALMGAVDMKHKGNTNIGSCVWHFEMSLFGNVSFDIGSATSNKTLIRFGRALKDAATPGIFEKISEAFETWIGLKPSRSERLKNWWSWWKNRAPHWSQMGRNVLIPNVTGAEAGNAHFSKKTALTLSGLGYFTTH